MKKYIAIIVSFLLVMTVAVSGCAQVEDTAEMVTPAGQDDVAAAELNPVAAIDSEYIGNDDSENPSYAVLVTAKDEAGEIVWQYTTPYCKEFIDCDTAQYIGRFGDYALVNEQGLADGSEGGLRALNTTDGSTAWVNSDYTGVGSCALYDEETGIIYISGFYGPTCMAIGADGNTIWKVDQTVPGRSGAYEMSFDEIFGGIPGILIKFAYDENVDNATSFIFLDGSVASAD